MLGARSMMIHRGVLKPHRPPRAPSYRRADKTAGRASVKLARVLTPQIRQGRRKGQPLDARQASNTMNGWLCRGSHTSPHQNHAALTSKNCEYVARGCAGWTTLSGLTTCLGTAPRWHTGDTDGEAAPWRRHGRSLSTPRHAQTAHGHLARGSGAATALNFSKIRRMATRWLRGAWRCPESMDVIVSAITRPPAPRSSRRPSLPLAGLNRITISSA